MKYWYMLQQTLTLKMSVVTCISTSFLFIAKYHSISHFVCSFVSWWTFELFQFLVVVIMPQWICIYKFMYGRIFLFLLGICLRVESPGHMISLRITLKICILTDYSIPTKSESLKWGLGNSILMNFLSFYTKVWKLSLWKEK